MHSEVVELALKLIDLESVTGNEKTMSEYLENRLKQEGWQVVRQEVEPGRDNIYATRPGHEPKLVFNSHIDTVPPFFPAEIKDGVIRGRGACDTKSLIAAQLLAARTLIESGIEEIGLLYVVGEEVDHCGMIKANELNIDPQFLIVGEPTESKLVRRQKGIFKFRLESSGKAAHSGYPHTGVSAIDPLLDVLQDLKSAAWPSDVTLGETTLNIGVIGGGRAANVVPDKAFADVMIRVTTSQAEINAMVDKIINGRVPYSIVSYNDPCELTTLEGYETVVVSFNTDIPYLKFSGKALLWGAGSIQDAHTAREFIRVTDLEAAVGTYEQLARQCLGK